MPTPPRQYEVARRYLPHFQKMKHHMHVVIFNTEQAVSVSVSSFHVDLKQDLSAYVFLKSSKSSWHRVDGFLASLVQSAGVLKALKVVAVETSNGETSF